MAVFIYQAFVPMIIEAMVFMLEIYIYVFKVSLLRNLNIIKGITTVIMQIV